MNPSNDHAKRVAPGGREQLGVCAYCGQEEGHSKRCSVAKFGVAEMRMIPVECPCGCGYVHGKRVWSERCCGQPTHVWFWRKFLGDRKGQRCRVWARGRNGNLGIEFEDGYRVIAPRYAVRRIG